MNQVAQQVALPSPGAVLAGRFRLERSLGSGGMAEVFRAIDISTGRAVAIKVLRAQHAQSAEALARLKREADVLTSLRHPAIVAIESSGTVEGGLHYLAMELLEGETLGARMRRGIIEPPELAPIVAGTAAGLAAAHARGVVHRDLKPDNIFLQKRGDDVQVKLLDFGISKVWGGERLTATGQVLGTPRYMSPEQLGTETEIDHRVDVYSLGVIMYEALAHKPPFLASTPTDLIVAILHGKVAPLRSLRPDLSPAVEAVVMRAMARARDARFRAATELADAFIDVSGGTALRRALPRAGMQTTPLGSMRQGATVASEPPPAAAPVRPPIAVAATQDILKPGTFSAFEAVDAVKLAAQAAPFSPPVALPIAPQPAHSASASTSGPRAAITVDATAPRGPHPATRALAPEELPQPSAPQHPQMQAGYEPRASSAAASGVVSASALGSTQPVGAHQTERDRERSRRTAHPARELAEPPPRRGLAVLLIVAGLLAGGLTAALVLAGLHYMRASSDGASSSSPPPPPPPPTSSGTSEAVGTATAEASTAEGAGATQGEASAGTAATGAPQAGTAEGQAEGQAQPPPPDTAQASTAERGTETAEGATGTETATAGTESARAVGTDTATTGTETAAAERTEPEPRHRERRTHGDTTTTTTATEAPRAALPTAEEIASDPLGSAQRALRGGDPSQCVDILDDLIAHGATPIALRRRADCLMRRGDRDEAMRDYQRFCRIAPDHPAVPEVRSLLAGMGSTCP